MQDVRIFEVDASGFLVSRDAGASGPLRRRRRLAAAGRRAHRVRHARRATARASERLQLPGHALADARSRSEMVSVALLKPDRMSTIDLFQYIRHLEANGQTSQRYEIEFWRKVFYPLSLPGDGGAGPALRLPALPPGGITTYVFGGVLIGISFFLLNNVFGYIGNLQQLVALADGGGAGADLLAVVAGAPSAGWCCGGSGHAGRARPSSCSGTARATRCGARRSKRWRARLAQLAARACRCAAPTWNWTRPTWPAPSASW